MWVKPFFLMCSMIDFRQVIYQSILRLKPHMKTGSPELTLFKAPILPFWLSNKVT